MGPVISVRRANADLARFAENSAQSINPASKGGSDTLGRFGGGVFAKWQGDSGSLDASAQYVGGSDNLAQARMALDGAPGITVPIRSTPGQLLGRTVLRLRRI